MAVPMKTVAPRATPGRSPVATAGAADGRPHIQASPMPDGKPVADRDAPGGGQAVLGGVVMRGVAPWAVAVRKRVVQASETLPAAAAIEVTSEPLVSWAK